MIFVGEKIFMPPKRSLYQSTCHNLEYIARVLNGFLLENNNLVNVYQFLSMVVF